MNDKKTIEERLMRGTRFALAFVIVLLLILIASAPRDDTSGFPRFMSRANAEAVAATPGILVTSIGTGLNERFYVVDRGSKCIGCYGLNGDHLRLHAARKFDNDVDILAGEYSMKGQTFKIEDGNGASHEELKGYGKRQSDEIETLVNPKKAPK